jgi:DNA-binding IclR family transcriptional regulator
MALLRALSDVERETGEGLGVMQLSARTGRDKSQVSRALHALEKVGFVERDAVTLRYRLGYGLFVLATRGIDRRLITVAAPFLADLANELGETTHLCTLAGVGVLTLESVAPPHHTFRASGWVGQTVPAQHGAVGRVLLGDATQDFVFQRFATTRFRSNAPNRLITNVRQFWSEIELARKRGYAVEDEEQEAGLVGAAAPVRNDAARIVAAVCVSAPKKRQGKHLERLGVATQQAANGISLALGWSDEPDRD